VPYVVKIHPVFINHNGKILPADQAIFGTENRAFRYGDGLFETIRMFEGKLPFWSYHWERLFAGAQYLKFQKLKDASFYKNEIQKLCSEKGNWRIRFSLFRKDGGLYTPLDFETDFLIETSPLETNHFELNTQGLKVDLCDTLTIPRHPLSNFKTINSLPYVLAGIYKKEKELDDCILLNDKGKLVEASSSNIFILKNKKLFTPPLSSGCKDGTMRKVIMGLAPELDLEVLEKNLSPKKLIKADEIWLTNAVQGLKWVAYFQDKKMTNSFAIRIIKRLNLLK
jgi:branched-subunit amino acid aminotransferase/4-amino-4-deoxychorismate lyase